jgi:hypothetical protein
MRDQVPALAGVGDQVMGVEGRPETWRRRCTKAFAARPKIVCGLCNNGWTSDLEEVAALQDRLSYTSGRNVRAHKKTS